MKIRLFLFMLAANAALLRPATALPLGSQVKIFPYHAIKILADPVRPRMYILDANTNSVIAIDTQTMEAAAMAKLDSVPADMALSRDNLTLYVANRDSAARAVSELDADSLGYKGELTLPYPGIAIAAGLDGRLYVAFRDIKTGDKGIFQVDRDGEVQGRIDGYLNNGYFSYGNLLQIAPDGNTLFVASSLPGYGDFLLSYDVSTATPVLTQHYGPMAGEGNQLVVSPRGKYVCLTGIGGNYGAYGPRTVVRDASNLREVSAFYNGALPTLAFTTDDLYAFQPDLYASKLHIYEIAKNDEFGTALLPPPVPGGHIWAVDFLALDHNGDYLFMDQRISAGLYDSTFQVVVSTTGHIPGPATLPRIELKVVNAFGVLHENHPAEILLTRTGGDLSRKLVVRYSLEGRARLGIDYLAPRGRVKFRAGAATALVTILPGEGLPKKGKRARLELTPGANYQLGEHSVARLTFLAP